MADPLQFTYIQGDGSVRKVIAAPIEAHSDANDNRTFKLYKNALDDDSTLFTDDSLKGVENNDIADEDNPDYLGTMIINQADEWEYNGDVLSEKEQRQIAENLIIKE